MKPDNQTKEPSGNFDRTSLKIILIAIGLTAIPAIIQIMR